MPPEPAAVEQAPRRHPIRYRIHLILEGGHNAGPIGAIFERSLVALIIANVLAVTLETVPSFDAAYGDAFDLFEFFSVVLFTLEYILRIWSAPEDLRYARLGAITGRLRYALRPLMIIDFLAVAPTYLIFFFPVSDLRFLRLFRLVRLLKIARYSPALSTLWHVVVSERRALFGTLILLLCIMSFSAQIMYAIEGDVQPELFGTLPDSMWWAITTLTTVGYGDTIPITALGKIIAGITMILGVGLIALPVGIIATGFVNEIRQRDFVVTWSMLSRMPLFEGFDIETTGEVMNALRSHIVAAESRLASAGEHPQAMYFVVSGHLDADHPDEEGTRRLGPGDSFGEEELLLAQPHRATVTARSHVRLLELSADDFKLLLKRFPNLRTRLEELTAKRKRN